MIVICIKYLFCVPGRTFLIFFWLNLQAKFAAPTSMWQAVRPPTSPCVVSPLLLRLSRKHIEVAWLWWLIPRQLHKHIEVYTNTTQLIHITMWSFWNSFKVIEKTQNYTKTNTQTCFSLASPQSTPSDQICVSDPSSHGRKRSHWRLPHPCYRSGPLRK